MSQITDDQYRLIERFFNNELKKEELPTFERQMQQSAFREMVQLQENLKLGLKKERATDPLLQLLRKEARQYQPDAATVPERGLLAGWRDWLQGLLAPKRRFAYAFATMAILLVGSTWWANRHYSNQSIVAGLHSPVLNDKTAGAPTQQELLDLAKAAFFEGEYERAEAIFQQIGKNDPQYPEAQTLLAYTYFQTGRFNESIPLFDQAVSLHFDRLPSALQDGNKLRWTRLLAYLGADRTEDPFFQEELHFFLKHKSDGYRQKAGELQRKVGSWWRKLVF